MEGYEPGRARILNVNHQNDFRASCRSPANNSIMLPNIL